MSPAQVGNLKAGEHHVMACLPAQRSPRRAGGPGGPNFDALVRTPSGDSGATRTKPSPTASSGGRRRA